MVDNSRSLKMDDTLSKGLEQAKSKVGMEGSLFKTKADLGKVDKVEGSKDTGGRNKALMVKTKAIHEADQGKVVDKVNETGGRYHQATLVEELKRRSDICLREVEKQAKEVVEEMKEVVEEVKEKVLGDDDSG